MGEGEMGVVMEGVGSGDASVRRLVRPFLLLSVGVEKLNVISQTIEVLYKLSHDLSRTIFGGYLESIVTSTNLSLPLEIQIQAQAQAQGMGIEERMKVKMGRRETAGRALEVCEVVARARARVRVGEQEGRSDGNVVDWGDVVSILVTLGETEKETGKDGEEDGDGWEEGVKRAMDLVGLCELAPLSFASSPIRGNYSAATKKLADQTYGCRRPVWRIANRCYTNTLRTVYGHP